MKKLLKNCKEGEKNDMFFTNYHYNSIMLYLLKIGRLKLNQIGKEPLCNGRYERAPHFGKKCFILCWRCTSLITTLLVCAIISFFACGKLYTNMEIWGLFLGGILLLPTILDGVFQKYYGKESTNMRRICFGAISGIGIWLLYSYAETILNKIF